jgi:hypothetical protein
MKKTGIILLACILLGCLVAGPVLANTSPLPNHPTAIEGPFDLEAPEVVPPAIDVCKTQVLPEGCLGYGFTTWMILYNSGAHEARVAIFASGATKYFCTDPFIVKPHQRLTLDMRLFNPKPVNYFTVYTDVSFKVVSDSPDLFAQESMYWNDGASGHTSCGFVE